MLRLYWKEIKRTHLETHFCSRFLPNKAAPQVNWWMQRNLGYAMCFPQKCTSTVYCGKKKKSLLVLVVYSKVKVGVILRKVGRLCLWAASTWVELHWTELYSCQFPCAFRLSLAGKGNPLSIPHRSTWKFDSGFLLPLCNLRRLTFLTLILRLSKQKSPLTSQSLKGKEKTETHFKKIQKTSWERILANNLTW